jgi:hypothetical protein
MYLMNLSEKNCILYLFSTWLYYVYVFYELIGKELYFVFYELMGKIYWEKNNCMEYIEKK